MKIAEYNDMMSYLTRPAPKTQVADLVDDLEPGALKDELQDKFDPDQETYEEYLQRKGLGERPFNASEGGSPLVPKPKPYTLEQFQERADLFIKGALGGFPKDEMINKLQLELDKAEESGILSREEAINFLNERTQQIKEFIQNNPGEADLSRVKKAIGGLSYGRENFFAGSSLSEYSQQIKDSWLSGKGTKDINKELGFTNDKSSTIDSLINSMRDPNLETPVKITKEEVATRPGIIGTNQTGTIANATERLKTFIEGFEIEKNRLPSSQELRRLGNFDFYTIKKAIEAGEIKILDAKTAQRIAQQESQGVNQQLLDLSKDEDINNIFKTGKTSVKDIKKVKKVIGNVSDSVAADRLLQLASIYAETGAEDDRGLNIKPKYKTNASNILDSSPYTGYIRNMYEALIGKSVGEPSIKGAKSRIVQNPEYQKTNIAKLFDIDEPQGVSSSVKRGSTPYGIFGQIIDANKNKIKVGWDGRKSQLELEVKEAINEFGVNSKEAKKAKNKYNTEAVKVQNDLNKGKLRGGKKITIPKISFDAPKNTIANYKNFNDTYKKAFDDVYKNNKYSFVIPKDLKTIPQLRKEVIDPNSSTYKQMINTLKKGFNEFDEKKLFDKINKATPDSFKKILKTIPRIASVDDFETNRFASANNVMTDATYVDDEEQTFAERNPITTGVGLTVPSAVAVQKAAGVPVLKALANIGKYPLKAVGSLPGAAYFAGDTIAERLEEGKSIPDAVIDKEVGIELLLPEAFKRFGPLMMKAARVSTPIGAGITGLGLAKDYYNFAKDEIAKVKAMSPEERQAYNESLMNYSVGGRVGFADGPEDPSKRKFMKIMGGLASLPLVGRFFKIGEKAAPVIDAVKTEVAKGKPEWFDALVNKVIRMGQDVTERFATKDREIVNQIDIADGETVRVYRDLETDSVRVEYESPNNMLEEPVDLEYKRTLPDESNPKGSVEFEVTESGFVGKADGPDDYFIDAEPVGGTDIKDLDSDVSKLKEFATGQKPTMKEIVKNKKRKDKVRRINEGDLDERSQYITDRQGDYVPDPGEYEN